MSSLMNLHAYFMLNGVIAIVYLISRLMLSLPFFKRTLLQQRRLKLARYSFLIALVSFFLVPFILDKLPSNYQSNIPFDPIIKNATIDFFQQHAMVNEQLSQMSATEVPISINVILIIILIMGAAYFIKKYLSDLFVLKQFQQDAYCRHHINNIQLLFSTKADIPFCWSLFRKHFIVIPYAFLEKQDDLKLAIRHELQHIRHGDTQWLHFLTLIKALCFWNPFMKRWMNWLDELQEYACDEAIILHKKTCAMDYAQCLVNTASNTLTGRALPKATLGIQGSAKVMLYRRVDGLFSYDKSKSNKVSTFFAYLLSCMAALTLACVMNGSSSLSILSIQQVADIIKKSSLDHRFQIAATPEVVSEINHIRNSDKARHFLRQSLKRMKHYQPYIQHALKANGMPGDLLVVPLVESGYKPLEQHKNPVLAAGIWQIIPVTAKRLGLIVNEKRDDRLDTQLATNAALQYLTSNYAQFNDWKLAFVAYEIGEHTTERLIKKTGSHDAWVLARSSTAPESLKKTLAMFDASLIIMHNPSLVSQDK
jgi:membrane-bound lytic murein transglycosylase D